MDDYFKYLSLPRQDVMESGEHVEDGYSLSSDDEIIIAQIARDGRIDKEWKDLLPMILGKLHQNVSSLIWENWSDDSEEDNIFADRKENSDGHSSDETSRNESKENSDHNTTEDSTTSTLASSSSSMSTFLSSSVSKHSVATTMMDVDKDSLREWPASNPTSRFIIDEVDAAERLQVSSSTTTTATATAATKTAAGAGETSSISTSTGTNNDTDSSPMSSPPSDSHASITSPPPQLSDAGIIPAVRTVPSGSPMSILCFPSQLPTWRKKWPRYPAASSEGERTLIASMMSEIETSLKQTSEIPFTLHRLFELLNKPKEHYSTLFKYLLAVKSTVGYICQVPQLSSIPPPDSTESKTLSVVAQRGVVAAIDTLNARKKIKLQDADFSKEFLDDFGVIGEGDGEMGNSENMAINGDEDSLRSQLISKFNKR